MNPGLGVQEIPPALVAAEYINLIIEHHVGYVPLSMTDNEVQ